MTPNKKVCVLLKAVIITLLIIPFNSAFASVPFPGKIIAESPDPIGIHFYSPSIAILPDGTYVASHDWGGDNIPGVYSSVYRSTDKGENWQLAAVLKDIRWANLFVHNGALYFMGVKAGMSDITIRKSTDGGKTWTIATDNKTGILFQGRFHTGPTPVVVNKGRIWRAFEESPDTLNERDFHAFVISAPINSDLLNAANWTKSTSVAFNATWLNASSPEWCEGNVVVTPAGNVIDFMRVDSEQEPNGTFALECPSSNCTRYTVAAKINVSTDAKTTSFEPLTGFVDFPGALTKFTIRYDSVSHKYWSIANKITTTNYTYLGASNSPRNQRNVLILCSSSDLVTWEEKYKLIRWDEGKIVTRRETFGFQYPDWQFDGNDIVAAVRTSWYGSDWHDSNLLTFHRINNFRTITLANSPTDFKNLTLTNPILSWQFSSPKYLGTEQSAASTKKDANLNTSLLTRGSGFGISSFDRSFSAVLPLTSVASNDKAAAVLNNQYFQVVVQSKTGFSVSLSTIDAKLSRNADGPNSYRWAYSLDGINFVEICSGDIFDFVDPLLNGVVQTTIHLESYKDLQNVPSSKQITFRVYAWRGTLSTGRISIGRYNADDLTPSLVIGGEVLPTVEMNTPLVAWSFSGITGITTASVNASFTNSNLATSILSRGPGLAPISLSKAYYSSFTSNVAPNNGKSNALANNDYYSFNVQAKSGYNLSLTKLNAKLRRNGTGPLMYRWSYSIDGLNFIEIGSKDESFLDNSDLGVVQNSLDLSTIANLQKVSAAKSIIFRLYAWGATSNVGGLAFGRYIDADCLSVEGSLGEEIKLNAWQFYNDDSTISTGKEITYSSTSNDTCVAISQLTRGAGNTVLSGHSGGFVGLFTQSADKQTAIANNCYYEFKTQANSGSLVSLSTLGCKLRRQEFSAYIYRWMYSLNGVDFTEIGTQDITMTDFADNTGYWQPTLDLSIYKNLQNLTTYSPITFRLYAWGGSETTTLAKNFGFGQSKLATGPALIISGSSGKTTSITTLKDENSLSVFAGNESVELLYKNRVNVSDATIKIMDVAGKQMLIHDTKLNAGINKIFLSINLNKGVYILSFQNQTEGILNVKFTK